MRTLIALAMGRASRKIIRSVRYGGGSAVPGTIASKIQPKLFEIAIKRFPQGLIVVSGSSGKSSTTKFLVQILQNQGLSVFTNPSTANIKQGLFSAVLQGSKWLSLPKADIAVIEMDEAYAAAIGAPLQPRLSIITNVMDEQLDRFMDSEYVVSALHKLSLASKQVLANGNDPKLAKLKADNFHFFGLSASLSQKEEAPRYSVSTASPIENLDFEIIGESPLKMRSKNSVYELPTKAQGLHMTINFGAAISAAELIVTNIDHNKLGETADTLQGVYGRDTREVIRGVDSRILLVQNRESFRLNLLQAETAEQLFLAIGTDVKDPSWLWGVDFHKLNRVDILSGHHATPMKYRLQSCGVETQLLQPNFEKALNEFIQMEPPTNGERVFMVTADTFRRMKRILELSS